MEVSKKRSHCVIFENAGKLRETLLDRMYRRYNGGCQDDIHFGIESDVYDEGGAFDKAAEFVRDGYDCELLVEVING